ncbi:uncharacterized protein LOC109855247 isoform X2 [Pseudomyrmex gracilis]|uniref:uncharacterized protein LOC109855247 isoform X2 n=1 Tax=Pseudomyrmex gracilis TaxID=219809 RepID=UPI0009951308|nr:uncharacterized protein LOC109855247 isoform X2 [Pseudomyrmex gracilis]
MIKNVLNARGKVIAALGLSSQLRWQQLTARFSNQCVKLTMTEMIGQHNSENINVEDEAEHHFSLNSVLLMYGNKSVELEVTKDTVNKYQDSLAEEEKILDAEKQNLEELNHQVWSLEDSICDQVWQFSREHNFSVIFKRHPFVIESDCVKQKNTNNEDNSDVERSSELIDLINEIDNLKAEICSLNSKNSVVKQTIENALTKLGELQDVSDNVTELLRLIRPLESSCKLAISVPLYNETIHTDKNKVRRRKSNVVREGTRDCFKFLVNCISTSTISLITFDRLDAKNKKPRNNRQLPTTRTKSCLKNNKSNFTPNEELITTPKNYPQLSLEKSVIYTERTAITNVSEVSAEYTSDEKSKTFTLKKRSEISIRLEQHKYKDCYN